MVYCSRKAGFEIKLYSNKIKHNMVRKSTKLNPRAISKLKIIRPLTFTLAFGVIGLAVLAVSRADTHHNVLESEKSNLQGLAAIKSSTEASDNKFVEFGASGLDPDGRGPTGQWPDGFPAYDTVADIVTDGSIASLQSALNSLGSSGGVIEHPGNIPAVNLDRPTGPEIVVRPPIGQRANYTTSANPRSSNLLLAGWMASRMLISRDINNSGGFRTIRNSGWAWCEAEKNAVMLVSGTYADIEGLYYEVVYREYADPGLGDRGGTRGNGNSSSAGRGIQYIVGSIITGTVDQPPAHADTLQTYYDSYSFGNIYARDSVLWPSWDKMYQGHGSALPEFDNVYVVSPTLSRQAWNGPSDISFFSQPYHTTGNAKYTNSTIVGNSHPGATLQVSNSEFYNTTRDGRINDQGGNTNLTELPVPSSAPSHEQLDIIWSP